MKYEDHELAPATVLRGHVDADTAYVVDGYPYGGLRTQARYWLHTADKGAAAGQVRLMFQTKDPKASGVRWNKPKPSTYRPWAVLYRDSIDHVHWWPVGQFGPNPWEHLRFRLRGLFTQLDDTEREGYLALLRVSVGQSDAWERATRAFDLIAEGATPDEVSGLYEGHIHVSEQDHQIAVAALAAGLTV